MEDEKRRKEAPEEGKKKEDDLISRFPVMPPPPDVPEPPKLTPTLPPNPTQPQPGKTEPGAYGKAALAFTAASSLTMPIMVMSYLGWWLDKKFHTDPWLVLICFLLGLIAGFTGLMRVVKKLE